MKYYLIAGEASGDLHASNLMRALKAIDSQAEFRFFGGDLMAAQGGHCVKHYRELAYMGFVPVITHLPTILGNMRLCKRDIATWQPHAVILVDYPGFNLNIAKHLHSQRGNSPTPKVYYYISPKIWAWKEYRIKAIRRDIDELFSILPFEVDFYQNKHNYPIHYVGNPTQEEVHRYCATTAPMANDGFLSRNGLADPRLKPIIAVLCGSRKQEIKDNLPAMLQATDSLADHYQIVVAGAPAIEHDYYNLFTKGHQALVLQAGQTYQLLYNAHAALVTSGTATLETALFRVPQVVCYETPLPRLIGWLRKKVLNVKYISLVDLILDQPAVPELVADTFTVDNIRRHLQAILQGQQRQQQLDAYQQLAQMLGNKSAPDETARIVYDQLSNT